MICPICGKNGGQKNTCPDCGAKISIPVQTNKEDVLFPEPAVRKFKTYDCCMEINENSITFVKRPFFRKTTKTILLSQLYQVSYCAGSIWKAGYLSVRQWQDRHIPLPTRTEHAVNDETSIYFNCIHNEKAAKIYSFLKECTEIANTAAKTSHMDGTEALYGTYKGLDGSMDLHPDGVSFVKANMWGVSRNSRILYKDMAEVIFWEGRGLLKFGGLCVRSKTDKRTIRYKCHHVMKDWTSLSFNEAGNENMCKVYEFLCDKLRENNEN